jgi:hypothetical protein
MYLPNMIKKELLSKGVGMDKALSDTIKDAKKEVHKKKSCYSHAEWSGL